jgi:hypothetical protein
MGFSTKNKKTGKSENFPHKTRRKKKGKKKLKYQLALFILCNINYKIM